MEYSMEITCAIVARAFIKDSYGADASLQDHSHEFVDKFNELLKLEDAKPKKAKKVEDT